MADTQASAFGDIPALDLTNDRIPILDVSATGNDKNKLISPTNLMVSKLDLAGGTMTGQLVLNLASTTGALNLAPTWNNAGTAFNAIYARVTNTASAATSNLIDVGLTSSLFKVDKTGDVFLAKAAVSIMGSSGSSISVGCANGGAYLGNTASFGATAIVNSAGFRIRSDMPIGFSADTTSYGTMDVALTRDAAGILAIKNSTNAQKLRVYGTTTGSKYLQLHHEGDTGSGMGLITTSTGKLQLLGNDGVQLGSSGSSYIGFYGATPGARPGTGVSEAAFVENAGGTAVNTDSTFGGYTLQQLAQALQNLGLIDP